MTGDFTRDTFRPARGYSAVRMQQGRLFTDADWNEQGDIQRDALRGTARAVIGASGFPEDNPGFAITAGSGGQALLIGGGEAYVDGTRIVFASPDTLALTRASGAGTATKWQVDGGTRVSVGDYLVLAGNTPDQAVRVATVLPDVAGRQQFQGAAPLTPNNAATASRYRSVESQPFLPPLALPATAGDYLVYLDVWERPIGVLDDPAIRESAFGGPDTAGRDQTIWQVRIASLAELAAAGAVTLPASCKSFGAGWTPFGPGATGRMAARAEAATAAVDPCVLPAAGGYRSLENHLYRVEIHNGGAMIGGGVSIKWSRDNAIHRAAYDAIDNNALLVDSLGRDAEGSLKRDDWIEIRDEARQLAGQPGFFARISDVNGTRVSIGELRHPDTLAPLTANGAPDLSLLPAKGQVRRWEGGPPVKVAANAWIALENGVEVRFGGGRYATGDYWLIPARSISASIEWPRDEADGAPASLPPAGIAHHYAALALATRAANGIWTLTDCRALFPPLTALRSFLYLGGDGQEAMPDPLNPGARIALAAEVRVGVVRGRTPVQGATVRFEVTQGDGRLGPVADNLKIRTVLTGADGIARLAWSVDATMQSQQVVARLLDSGGTPTHAPITFTAALRTAAQVSFDPANTPPLAGENTVQKAIEKLATMQQTGCSTYVIVEGSDWVTLLESLKPDEDAAICFQRGTYETDRPVRIEKAGHLTLSGAGGGTRIIAWRSECALRFSGCASVTLHDLDVSAPDGSGTLEAFALREGPVTILDCPEVDVSDLDLRCGGGAATERTCLTIRGMERPLSSVRVLRNRLVAGYAQDGILVTDCIDTLIADNALTVAPGKGGQRPERLFEDSLWRKRLVSLLVAKPMSAGDSGRGGQIRGGDFVATFPSAVPREEWDALVAANPPSAADIRSARAFEAFVRGIVEKGVAAPDLLPTFRNSLRSLETRIGGVRMGTLDDDVKRSFAMAADPVIERIAAPEAEAGKVIVAADAVRITFGSPVNQADWSSALRLMPADDIAAEADLIRHVRKVAVRMIADDRFRDRLGSLKNWFDRFRQSLPSHGRQAITCGGRLMGEVTVRGNRTEGFIQGVHIGASSEDDKPVGARTVTVADNALFLRKPGEEIYCPMGLFVGNADTVRIQRNTLAWAANRTESHYAHGIRVWGHIGRYLLISENRISTADIGIRVKSATKIDNDHWGRYLWVAADNLVEETDPSLVVRGPPFLRSRDNRPQ